MVRYLIRYSMYVPQHRVVSSGGIGRDNEMAKTNKMYEQPLSQLVYKFSYFDQRTSSKSIPDKPNVGWSASRSRDFPRHLRLAGWQIEVDAMHLLSKASDA